MPHQNIMRTSDSHLKSKRHFVPSVFIVLMLFLSGCGTMMVMLGDNIRYSISGKVQDSAIAESRNISDAKVSLECPGTDNSIYQNRKGTTDQTGQYQLSGYWELEGCTISFVHESYSTNTIEITQIHLIRSEGLSRTYEVNAQLE